MNITQLLNGNAFSNRNGYRPKWVILHGTAGGTSAQAIASYFKSTEGGGNPVSANYVIGQDGTIVMCNPETDGAWANGYLSAGHDSWWDPNINPNNVTISIEHCKPSSDNSDALTPAQQASSFALIADICTRNGIPARVADASGGITGHFSIDPVNRSRCPGTYDWNALWTYLKGNSMTIPAGWADDGTTLKASNGVPVVAGFRQKILAMTWDPGNVPQSAEYGVNPVQLHNPALGGGTVQVFRDCILWWTSAQGVVLEPYPGLEVWAAYQEIAQLQAQQPKQVAINTLNTCISVLQGGVKQLSS